MAILLLCGDAITVRVRRDYFKKSVFNNPEIATARSYTLRCKARSEIVNCFLDWVDGESEELVVTKDSFNELQSLCDELGFSGLHKTARSILDESYETGSGTSDVKDFMLLKERVTRHDKCLAEIQRQLSELLHWKQETTTEIRQSMPCQFQKLERKVDEFEFATQACKEENVEIAPQADTAPSEGAKPSVLIDCVAHLKETENTTSNNAIKTPAVVEPKQPNLPLLSGITKWRQMRNNRVKMVKPISVDQGQVFFYDESQPFKGIIAHLTAKCRENVHDKGIVNVLTNGSSQSDHPKRVAYVGTNSFYQSQDMKNSWICYDFLDRRIVPTRYTLRTYEDGPGWHHLKSWTIEVSNDGYSWEEIDRQVNNTDLNGSYASANFQIFKALRNHFRFFRLRQIGPNHRGMYCLSLSSLEIFGTLVVQKKTEQPQQREFLYHAECEAPGPPSLWGPPKLDGIIMTLACKWGDLHGKGIVNVTASSVYHIYYPRNAANPWTEDEYMSRAETLSWICYEFKEQRFIPKGYSVKSKRASLRSWVIEVSNDGTEGSWTEIDRQRVKKTVYDEADTATFKISHIPSESVRFFRLIQTGRNRWGNDYLMVTALEIFGILFEK